MLTDRQQVLGTAYGPAKLSRPEPDQRRDQILDAAGELIAECPLRPGLDRGRREAGVGTVVARCMCAARRHTRGAGSRPDPLLGSGRPDGGGHGHPQADAVARPARRRGRAPRPLRRLGDAGPVPPGSVPSTPPCASARAIFDVSHMGQVETRGPGAEALLQRLVTNDVTKLAEGGAQYSLLCNEDGGVLDDLFTYRLGPDRFLTVTNAANHERDLAWFEAHATAPTRR